jgi:carbonic anhydrase
MNLQKSTTLQLTLLMFMLFPLATCAVTTPPPGDGTPCKTYGPQTPRDIDDPRGLNTQKFSFASSTKKMNLCNIHFHEFAEHKAKDYAIFEDDGKHSGYICNISKTLTNAELRKPTEDICKGLKPGDTIEVHWVHSSCQVKPGAGLGACSSTGCANPELRVEAQVFTLVNDPLALNFNDFDAASKKIDGFYQAKSFPSNTGVPVKFLGSTTGPSYNESACSSLQVSWSVRPNCAKLNINSLGKWCKANSFSESHAHGVRKLVVNLDLLSEIKSDDD